MPINGNIGNLSYVLCAVCGALMALKGIGGTVTIGTIIAFVTLNKSFTQPITQISQQLNSIIMASAGANRVFELMDEKPEEDHGYVQLVNATEDADGTIHESKTRTDLWAWKHPHQADGSVTYEKLKGEIVMDGVDFGYDPFHLVLHDVRLYAKPGQKIAFVGSTGAGKTTITNLINRFYDIQDGYVQLVNATEDADGTIHESKTRTDLWAWKHPHQADGSVTYEKLKGEIVMDGVDFGYDPFHLVLHDVRLYAKPGQKIAFVGSTGAGKTTITNLINRFYDIQDGKIRYDGINITKIRKSDLRRSLGMVFQDTHLFTGTVLDNIRYGKLNATDEECMDAARLANADGFIRRLPNGYRTILTADGASLSQGQRQLLAIARAAVADPPVLILDEATSSIDTRTEALVQAGMDALMKGRTTFVIAHRLSKVKNSDCIMVLEQGRIIERGNHDDLIAQKEKYYQLYTENFAEG